MKHASSLSHNSSLVLITVLVHSALLNGAERPPDSPAGVADALNAKGGVVIVDEGQIIAASLRGSTFGDPDVSMLAKMPSLGTLSLSRSGVTDAGVRSLGALNRLDSFVALHTSISDESVAPLVKANPRLEKLWLSWTRVGNRSLEEIAKLKCMSSLALGGVQADPQAFQSLARVHSLADLDLREAAVGDDSVASIAKLPSLISLCLNGTKVTDKGLAALKGNRTLEELEIARTSITDDGLVHLATLSSLRSLDLSGSAVTDAGLKSLATLRTLQVLQVDRTKFTDAAITALMKARPALRVFPIVEISPRE